MSQEATNSTSDAWTVQLAREDDAREIACLIQKVAASIFAQSGSKQQLEAWIEYNASSEKVRRRIQDRDTEVILIKEKDGSMVATGFIQLLQTTTYPTCELGGIYCQTQGKGLGTAILRGLLQQAKLMRQQRARLTVGAENRVMQNLIHKFGFRKVEEAKDRYFFVESLFYTFELQLHPADCKG